VRFIFLLKINYFFRAKQLCELKELCEPLNISTGTGKIARRTIEAQPLPSNTQGKEGEGANYLAEVSLKAESQSSATPQGHVVPKRRASAGEGEHNTSLLFRCLAQKEFLHNNFFLFFCRVLPFPSELTKNAQLGSWHTFRMPSRMRSTASRSVRSRFQMEMISSDPRTDTTIPQIWFSKPGARVCVVCVHLHACIVRAS